MKITVNAHAKTILTIVSFIAIFAILLIYPTVAKWTYIGFWCLLAAVAIAWVYSCIYMMFKEIESVLNEETETVETIVYDY